MGGAVLVVGCSFVSIASVLSAWQYNVWAGGAWAWYRGGTCSCSLRGYSL